MDLIYRISGREAKELNKTIVDTQNILNAKITELDTEQSLCAAYAKRVTLLEKAERYYVSQMAELNQVNKNLRATVESEINRNSKAEQEIQKANILVQDAKDTVFLLQKELELREEQFNELIADISKLRQQLDNLQKPTIPTNTLNAKLHNMRKGR